jgi:hypothetical protein
VVERTLNEKRTRRVGARLAGVVLVAGLAAVVVCAVRVGAAVAGTLNAPSFTIPGSTVVDLETGTYAVYEHTGTQGSAGPVSMTFRGRPTLGPDDVVVTDPAGAPVPLSATGLHETVTRGSDIYTGVLEFRAPAAGPYRVEAEGTGPPTTALVGRELGDLFGALLPWIGGVVLGLIVAGIADVVLVVGSVRAARRRRRERPLPPPPGGGSPGNTWSPGYPSPPPAPGWGPGSLPGSGWAPPPPGPAPAAPPPGWGPPPGYAPAAPPAGWGPPPGYAPAAPPPGWSPPSTGPGGAGSAPPPGGSPG